MRVLRNTHAALSWNGKITCHLSSDILNAYVDGENIDPDVFTRVVRRPCDDIQHGNVPLLLLVPAAKIHTTIAAAARVLSVPKTSLHTWERKALVKTRPVLYEGICKYIFRAGSVIKDDLYVRVDYNNNNHAAVHVGRRSTPNQARVAKLEVKQQVVCVQFLTSDTVVVGIRDTHGQCKLYLWNFVTRQVTARTCIAIYILHVHLDHFSLLQRTYTSPMVIVCSKREAQLVFLNSDETAMVPSNLFVSDIRCVASSVTQEQVLLICLLSTTNWSAIGLMLSKHVRDGPGVMSS